MEYFVAWIACVLIGALIGKYKGRADSGVLWSALLGPIGWIIVALMGGSPSEVPALPRRNSGWSAQVYALWREPGRRLRSH